MPILTITDATINQINAIGRFRQPNEAVGIVLKRKVIELPNRSMTPRNGFEVRITDIELAVEIAKMKPTDEDWEEAILWHTHPAGSVGPSQVDKQNKLSQMFHLVVALTDKGPEATFY